MRAQLSGIHSREDIDLHCVALLTEMNKFPLLAVLTDPHASASWRLQLILISCGLEILGLNWGSNWDVGNLRISTSEYVLDAKFIQSRWWRRQRLWHLK